MLFPDNIRNSWTKICTWGENNVMEKQIFSQLVLHCYFFQKSGWKYGHTAWNGKILCSIYKKRPKGQTSKNKKDCNCSPKRQLSWITHCLQYEKKCTKYVQICNNSGSFCLLCRPRTTETGQERSRLPSWIPQTRNFPWSFLFFFFFFFI